jgi:hypothetical protein
VVVAAAHVIARPDIRPHRHPRLRQRAQRLPDAAFDETTIPEAAQAPLAAAARWLACNPGVEVVILPDADNHGDAAHLNDLAQRRAQAVAERLRTLGATAATLRILPRRAPDPVTAPHLVINAQGRGW